MSIRVAWRAVLLLLTVADAAASQADEWTEIPMPSGHALRAFGHFSRRETLWPDAALGFRLSPPHLAVIDAGSRAVRIVREHAPRAWSRLSGPAWSEDRASLFVWLDVEQQLAALDVDTGAVRSLSALPRHVWNYKGDEHLDPSPVWRRKGVVHDAENGVLLFLTREEGNEHVAAWQRSAGRGGHELVALDLQDGSSSVLATKAALPATVRSWDLSTATGRLYLATGTTTTSGSATATGDDASGQRLEERRLNGQLVRSFPAPEGGVDEIALSPDGRTLLVSRARSPRPDVDEAWGGGFVLLDLESGTVQDAEDRGWDCVWSPDGALVAYVYGWGVRWHCVYSEDSWYAVAEVPTEGQPSLAYRWSDPVWSRDRSRLALSFGGADEGLLVLDYAREQYLLVTGTEDQPLIAEQKFWWDGPAPFPREADGTR